MTAPVSIPGPIRGNNHNFEFVSAWGDVLDFCRTELFQAVETSMINLLEVESAPARIFVRSSNVNKVIATVDSDVIYGSHAIVRS